MASKEEAQTDRRFHYAEPVALIYLKCFGYRIANKDTLLSTEFAPLKTMKTLHQSGLGLFIKKETKCSEIIS